METYAALIGEAERGYNGLLSQDYKAGMVLTLLAVMDHRRDYKGRAIALLQVAIARLLDWRQNLSEDDKPTVDKWLRDAYSTMAMAHMGEGRRDEAQHHFEQALRYGDNDPEVMSAFAGLYINDGQPQKCIDLINKARKAGLSDSDDYWNLALAHLELGHWVEGFKLYHKGIMGKERLNKNYWRSGNTPIWDGEPDQTVVVYGEQGVGDEIMFASCLAEAAQDCKHLIFDCHPRLEALFRRSFPDLEIHGTRKEAELDWAAGRTDIDACIPIGSLPMYYRRRDADFPQHDGYLTPDPDRVAHYRARLAELGPGPYAGIAWEGGVKKSRFDLRSAGLKAMSPLLDLPATWISLHYMPEAADAAAKYGLPHWQEAIDDLDEMAALIAACDFVVSVNQSLVHQAGALGTECHVLTPARPAWRYHVQGEKMVWYPSVRQYRQRFNEEPSWQPAVSRLKETLASRIGRMREEVA